MTASDRRVSPALNVMSSEGVKRLLVCDSAEGSLFAVNSDLFHRRLHKYLTAKAALEDPETPDDDETRNMLWAEVEISEVALLCTPAAFPIHTWTKLAILEEAITSDFRDGHDAQPRVLMALASLKHDLLRFGLGDGKHEYPTRVV